MFNNPFNLSTVFIIYLEVFLDNGRHSCPRFLREKFLANVGYLRFVVSADIVFNWSVTKSFCIPELLKL